MTPLVRSRGIGSLFDLWPLTLWCVLFTGPGTAPAAVTTRVFTVHGVVCEVSAAAGTVVIRHHAIPGYMAAMTMPFKVKDVREIPEPRRDDEIVFQLHVTADESWGDGLLGTDRAAVTAADPPGSGGSPVLPGGAFLDFAFTNQPGQPVRWHDFHDQALAITFFTRADCEGARPFADGLSHGQKSIGSGGGGDAQSGDGRAALRVGCVGSKWRFKLYSLIKKTQRQGSVFDGNHRNSPNSRVLIFGIMSALWTAVAGFVVNGGELWLSGSRWGLAPQTQPRVEKQGDPQRTRTLGLPVASIVHE
jgi:Cu/Ag efflux protein CusF